MANKIKLRRSYVAGVSPSISDLEVNEVAINYADGVLYVRTPQNTIQSITLGGSGGGGSSFSGYETTSSFPATGSTSVIYVDESTGRLYRWNGAAYSELGPLGGGGSGGSSFELYATESLFPSTGSDTVIYCETDSGRLFRWAGSAGYTEIGPIGGGSGTGEDTTLRAYFVPAAPTNLAATAGNAQASLTWTAPSVISQIPITDYVVQYSSNSGTTWTTFSDGTGTTTSATVTGLTNGTAYTFRVAAINGVGQGAWSSASSSVTPAGPTPVITIATQPSNQIANSSGAATFSVSATVTEGATLSYQWQKQEGGTGSFANVSGATSSTLALSGLSAASDEGDVYRVVVSATGGASSVTSSAATLSVPIQSFTATAVLLTSGTSYTVPAGATSMKAWAVGSGGVDIGQPGGAGGCAYKTWSVTGGSSVTYSCGAAIAMDAFMSGNTSTVTYGGTTISGGGGATWTGGGYSGGDGGANGGEPVWSGSNLRGGAVGGNGAITPCGRFSATDVSGLFAALQLAGVATTETICSSPPFGFGSLCQKFGNTRLPGLGGGGVGTNMTFGIEGTDSGAGAVVLYFT